jgi:osmotically-inducible protein OsmY
MTKPINNISLLAIVVITTMTLPSCIPVALTAGGAAGMSLVQERSVGNAVDDTSIWTKIKNDLFQNDKNNSFSNVHVKVSEGRVLLSGTVPTHEAKMEAVKRAWEHAGVKEVINDISVEVPTGKLDIGSYSHDTWITTQARAKILLNKDIRSVNYTIDTRNGVVHIMGVAQSQKELDLITNIIREISGVTKVLNYARLKNSPLRNATAPQN